MLTGYYNYSDSNSFSDVPSIVSGNRLAFLEPQERVWEGQSGRWFSLQELSGSDHLNCLNGISNFNSRSGAQYNKTLFRFPLRSATSNLSDNVYTLQKVNELIDALRSEAKLLLLFLRSVHTIEVYNIDHRGNHTLTFQAKIADAFVADVKQKRATLLRELKSCHISYGYNFSSVLKFTAKFDVSVYDANTRLTSISHWLVANQVGSSSPTVRAAAVKQKVFPWVGTAVELDRPGNGRIFCFLPMPIETASNLPVHVNGTFGLNDDRRSLKWPGVERRNDPMADWNKMLVTEVIPSCYVNLLLEYKRFVSGKADFYTSWPNVSNLKYNTQWVSLMSPVFSSILSQGVIWCETPVGMEWVTPGTAVYIPRSGSLPGVIKNALSTCGVKLAQVPANMWDACSLAGVPMSQVTPKYMRDKLRAYPHSYASCVGQDKKELLKYCLSDGQYSDLVNLQLLPLSNNSFTTFQNYYSSAVYMCTAEFPKWLLPNFDHKLVCLNDDPDLNSGLMLVGQSNCTQLRLLSVAHVAALLDEVMSRWRNHKIVSFSNQYFPSDWFEKFWNWVRNKQLQSFQNKLVLPVQRAHNVPATREFQVIRLAASQPVLYFPSHSAAGSNTMLSVLDKLGVQYCTQTSFPYVQHSQLTSYIKEYSPSALLDMMALKGSYASVSFTSQEAELMRITLYQVSLTYQNQIILQNLKIFSSCVNSSNDLYSISQVYQISLLKQVIVQPSTTIDLSVLPSNVIIFSTSEYYQNQLLHKLGHGATEGVNFLTQHIFPKLPSMGDRYIDPIMTRVLDIYPTLRYSNSAITSGIQYLEFVKVASGARKRPCDLYDPSKASLRQIFIGQGVFPCAPYDVSKYSATLRLCGLRTSVEPQAILDLIYTLSLQARSYAQEVDAIKVLRVRAIMEYISSSSFQNKTSGSYTLDRSIKRGYVSFSTALTLLSTHRSWLPVLAERPSNYPASLPWKGSGYTSHLISLQGSVCVSNSGSTTLPLLYGSQVYFTETFDSVTAEEPKGCLVAHFQEVIARKNSLAPNEMLNMIRQIYYAMTKMTQSRTDVQHLKPLKAMKEWVYIKKYHKFVSIDAVALKQNPGFRHNMEPYLHILPDSISGYSQLFKAFGMNDTISESQIVSILAIIRKEVGANQCSVSTEEAWSTVLAILNWHTENGTKKVDNEAVYVPAESDSQWPDLREPRELVYTDNEFLKTVVSSDNDELLTYVHDRINQSLAKSLMITPLSEELDISEDTFEDAGQHEPLIVRLKNILRDYKDGLTIVKELIQNADDAEATEVDICFDSRQHTSERNRLFFPDMCESHGPALVIHNNSQFSHEDFANIQKLAGGTKQGKHLKIGKFGIGFCSVYHITDVPSFVSRERLYIFDPTLNHLRKAVKNPSQPGKKVNYMTKFIQKSKQMEPYEGLFGFKKATAYNGTMFRLPFRTNASELSSTCYSQSTFTELLTSIQESGDKLLLFLQNVQKITVQQFDAGMTAPRVLYELRRHVPQPSLPLDNASIVTLESKSAGKSSKVPMSWLVASYSTTYDKKPALAKVACSLNTSHSYDSSYTVNSDLAGEMFCFLPLSQATGLPVHVSCNFAVINNRRGIWTSAQEGTSIFDPEVQWNIFLTKNVIPVAYSKLLSNLKTLFDGGSLQKYNFSSLWPLTLKLVQRNPWEECVKMLYTSLVQAKLFYSESTSQWLSMRESKFLDPDILGQPGSLPCVLDVIHHLNLPLVELHSSYKSHLNLACQSLTEKEFVGLFFTNLSQLSSIKIRDSRNDVIMYMLEAYATQYDDESELVCLLEKNFSSHAFIPTSPDGSVLRKCTDIVSPEATFAGLFDMSDHRFPLKTLADRHLVMTALREAGMMESTLNWVLIIDRAQSVEALMGRNQMKALERVRLIVKTLSGSVDGKPPSSGTTIDSVKFLPVMRKPKHYPLSWYGDGCKLLSGRQLVLSEVYIDSGRDTMERIAGSQAAFVCENLPKDGGCGYVNNYETRKLLWLRDSPSLCEVIAQLKAIIDQFNSSSPPQLEWITTSCEEIYKFMERAVSNGGTNLDELREIACIWNGRKFLDINSMALSWKLSDGPYLYTAPPSVAGKEKLTKILGIKKNFTGEDARKALENIKSYSGSKPIDKSCEKLVIELLSIFLDRPPKELETLKGKVFLPDTKNVLRKSCDLVFNDVPWAPMDETSLQVSEKLTRELAISLGVRLVRSKILEQYVSKKPKHFRGVPFGQHEELTRRIQNIIRDYPFDETVLKELLQNADDAKATKMYIILDRRTHGKSSVISEEWQKLQGPALLVWNDSVFTEKDLEGIQQLGLGSKRSEAETIGQYGIGFNVVYHLTDCPSFITNGNTLCVLDPHCRYAPEAKEALPGARYDDLKNGFWEKFADMSSAYLQDGLDGVPMELQGGSLFRLPIRHTYDMVKSSKIVDPLDRESQRPLKADDLSRMMQRLMPMMKQAMFFLNHVTEIKYLESDCTESNFSLVTKFHFKTEIAANNELFQDALSRFTLPQGSQPCVIQYPLTLTEIGHDPYEILNQEKWLIQQGVGDINNESQYWKYVNTVKPRHAIAAPLQAPKSHESGQLFCFLPLPVNSRVPVHINGSFVLDSSRRGLWKSTNPDGGHDDRSRWNAYLFEAIASSYANFLVQARQNYLKSTYDSWKQAIDDLHNYYHLFPSIDTERLMSFEVYKALIQSNSEVLCVLVTSTKGTKSQLTVKWHPVSSHNEAYQIYFWPDPSNSECMVIHPVLQSIGMKITFAPSQKIDSFNSVARKMREDRMWTRSDNESAKLSAEEEKTLLSVNSELDRTLIPSLSPNLVFDYYTMYSEFSRSCGMQPCPITETSFRNADTFLLFTKYLLKAKLETPLADRGVTSAVNVHTESVETTPSEKLASWTAYRFPDSPFSHFLLLSADGIIRDFDIKCKILSSAHSQLFPNHADMFLHPAMKVVTFDPSYFISQEDSEDGSTINRVLDIFEGTLPSSMQGTKVVSNASDIIPKQLLASYWKCFDEDKVLACFLPNILNHWALLLTTDNRLFSTASEVLPVYLSSHPTEFVKQVCGIMQMINIPFLDDMVVVAKVNCPMMSDHEVILCNFYHSNMYLPLTSVITNTHIETLIQYFSETAKPGDSKWVQHISSLPFFMDVVDKYLPIAGKSTFIWPEQMCSVGYSNWNCGSGVVFVQSEAKWTSLGSAEQLSISKITAENMYQNFIFSKFHTLREAERYSHLEYIKDCVYPFLSKSFGDGGKNISKYNLSQRSLQKADGNFATTIKQLRCIGPDDTDLKPINAFCIPMEIETYQFLFSQFKTLPDQFNSDEWLNFFSELGLNITVSQDDYLKHCHEVTVNDYEQSECLTQYIFSKKICKLWCKDMEFLRKVSDIPFVFTTNISLVNWVAGSHQAEKVVKLRGAASHHLMKLLWTVKPLIKLPIPISPSSLYKEEETCSMLEGLGISIEASIHDVIKNVQNICSGRYSDEAFFEGYPSELLPPETVNTDLLEIMHENLKFLDKHVIDKIMQIKQLSEYPCIPVHCDTSLPRDDRKMVLVKPAHIICSSPAENFHPFLHDIPQKLKDMTQLFTAIGVQQNLELHHLQMVLEKSFQKSSGRKLDPHTKLCVRKAMSSLLQLLCSYEIDGKECSAAALAPLYLPDTNDEMKLSTALLYCDYPSFLGYDHFDLSSTPHSYLSISEAVYGIDGLDLCRQLPEPVRPNSMSVKCSEVVAGKENEPIDYSLVSLRIMRSVHLDCEPLAIVKIFKKFSPIAASVNVADIERRISAFISALEIVTVKNLKANLILRESGKIISQRDAEFFFQTDEGAGGSLYIDSDFDEEDDIIDDIAEKFYGMISDFHCAQIHELGKVSFEVKGKLLRTMAKYMKVSTPEKKMQVLSKYKIDMNVTAEATRKFHFNLGGIVPHHRLSQDLHTHFLPMEYVGYEVNENHIAVAQVVHPVLSDEVDQLAASYHIYTGEHDAQGKDISGLSLHKFHVGTKNTKSSIEEERKIDLSETKAYIHKTVLEIKKLNPELQNKALKRFYLKWHPENNNTVVAQQLFLYLKEQITDIVYPKQQQTNFESTHYSPTTLEDPIAFSFQEWDGLAKLHAEEMRIQDTVHSLFDGISECRLKRPGEGEHLIQQAQRAFKVLCGVHTRTSSRNGYAFICSTAHQVAEKALKGGVYALCGMDGRGLIDHNLSRRAQALQAAKPDQTHGLVEHCVQLETYGVGDFDNSPEHFTPVAAEGAKKHAKAVLEIVKEATVTHTLVA